MAPVVKTEPQHKGEFLLSRGPGDISFEQMILKSGQNVKDGQLLADDGTGKLVASTGDLDSAGASAEDFKGFAYGDTDATAADAPVVVVARIAEVKASNVKLHPVTDGTADDVTAAVKKAIESRFLIVR